MITIGRRSNNTVVLSHSGVSSAHARLTLQGSAYLLEDLGSTNGTFVNGEPLSAAKSLQDGDVFNFGQEVACRMVRL